MGDVHGKGFVILRGGKDDPEPERDLDPTDCFDSALRPRRSWAEQVAYTRRKAFESIDGGRTDRDPIPPAEPSGSGGRVEEGD